MILSLVKKRNSKGSLQGEIMQYFYNRHYHQVLHSMTYN
jgi:hypothetical protein